MSRDLSTRDDFALTRARAWINEPDGGDIGREIARQRVVLLS